ncbi:transcriptional regulator [Halobacteriales archaeon SW_10_66_29]|jgi:CTP-dependent riboflavin kinase|nr:MAG: transcriptional regulator [Halobacteriales archaeon SW_10_66_29]
MNRDDEGKFNKQYPDEDFISTVESLPVASTQNVADEVGCSYDLAYRRLQDLEEEGDIVREEVGGSFVWTVA